MLILTGFSREQKKAIAALPALGKEAFERLQRINADRSATGVRRHEQNQELIRRKGELHELITHFDRSDRRGLSEVHQREERAEWDAELAHILAAQKALEHERENDNVPTFALERALDFIVENKARKFVGASVTPQSKKGQAINEAFDEARANVASHESQIKRTRASAYTIDEAERQLVADVEAKASKGRPNFSRLFKRDTGHGLNRATRGRIEWPESPLPGVNFGKAEEAIAFMVWLNKDAVIARGKEELRASMPEGAMTDKDRATTIIDLEEKLLAAERIEEYWLQQCDAAGLKVWRRPKANPLAVLQIAPAEEDFG